MRKEDQAQHLPLHKRRNKVRIFCKLKHPYFLEQQEKVQKYLLHGVQRELALDLGDIKKASIPDFGFEPFINFSTEQQIHHGWANVMNSMISKYPRYQKMIDFFEDIKKEKCMFKKQDTIDKAFGYYQPTKKQTMVPQNTTSKGDDKKKVSKKQSSNGF